MQRVEIVNSDGEVVVAFSQYIGSEESEETYWSVSSSPRSDEISVGEISSDSQVYRRIF